MIDTIVLRLHDLTYHYKIQSWLSNPSFSATVRKTKYLPFTEIKGSTANYARDTMLYGDSGIERLKSLRGNVHIPSSHYYLAFNIDNDKDYIEFNFSIPKYLYGNNVAQFIMSVKAKKFMMGLHYQYNEQHKYLYSRLIKFINHFFDENFPDCEVDYKKLELNRLDLCYNQVFSSKDEALRYLSYQKKLNMKNQRINGYRFNNYHTSIMYVGQNYSVKIYHKGTEFAKNDARELRLKNNAILRASGRDNYDLSKYSDLFEKGGYLSDKQKKEYFDILKGSVIQKEEFFDIEFLQGLSDRMLRYEMTFRKAMISKLYIDKVFRKTDKEYKKWMETFRDWWNMTKSGTDITLLKGNVESYPWAVKRFKYLLKWKRKTLSPKIDLLHRSARDNLAPGIGGLNQIFEFKFSEATLKEMCRVFHRFVKEFQVGTIDEETTLLMKIEKHNQKCEEQNDKYSDLDEKGKKYMGFKPMKRKSAIRMQGIYHLLLKYGSWDNIRKSANLSKATYYRYKKDFEEIGMPKNVIAAHTFNVETDFGTYLDIEAVNYNKLKYSFMK